MCVMILCFFVNSMMVLFYYSNVHSFSLFCNTCLSGNLVNGVYLFEYIMKKTICKSDTKLLFHVD